MEIPPDICESETNRIYFDYNYICTEDVYDCGGYPYIYTSYQSCDWELPGDISMDGNQDILDVIMLGQMILDNYDPSPMGEINADVDGNGTIELFDIIILLDLILDISAFVY